MLIALSSCKVTSLHPEPVAPPGLLAWEDLPARIKASTGRVQLERIAIADWSVDRSGLIDLDHPAAVAAGLADGPEAIQIVLFSVIHPQAGRYFIDTGISRVFQGSPDTWPVNSVIRGAMNMEALRIHSVTADVLKQGSAAGVFVTHLHLDHILGSSDIPSDVPFYVGPNEAGHRHWQNLVVQGSTDELLGQGRLLRELDFNTDGPAVSDYFGDGSFFIAHVPGHTPGSLAFVAVTPGGVHLMTGDTCHTAWGWKNNVPPGSFTRDATGNVRSLKLLKDLAGQIPGIHVHPGHQSL